MSKSLVSWKQVPTRLASTFAREENAFGRREWLLRSGRAAIPRQSQILKDRIPGFHVHHSRRSGDFAIVAAAATVNVVNGRAADLRLGVTGMGVVPQRVTALLVGNAHGWGRSAPPSSRPAATMAVTIPEYPVQRQI